MRIDEIEERNKFEKLLVSTVAKCSVCKPSDNWLGKYAYNEDIKGKGLWNSSYLNGNEVIDEEILDRFKELVTKSLI